MQSDQADSKAVRRLVGVYNADGSVVGELRYFLYARLGHAHCALCDITHGVVRPKRHWRARRDRLAIPFDTYHRDDQPDPLRLVYDVPPIVAAETDSGFVVLLGPREIEACHGSVEQLLDAVERALARNGLA